MATGSLRARPQDNPLLLGAGAAVAAGMAAGVLANLGTKSLLLVVAAAVVAGGMLAFRDRNLFLLFVAVAGMQFMLHKSFGPIDGAISSGAPALYITSLDAFVLFLFLLWWWDGGLLRDLKAAISGDRILLLPLLPVAGSIFSVFAAVNLGDALAELLRMLWMFALFLYIGIRVSGRRELVAVMAGLFLVALVQCGIVILQWLTHGHLGLSFLGEDSGSYIRTLNEGVLARPAGTSIHPDILAAITGPIGLLGLALALNLVDARLRWLCLLAAVTAFVPLALSQTRGAIVATAVAGLLLIGAALYQRRLSWWFVVLPIPALLGLVYYFWPKIHKLLFENLQSQQFHLEVDARLQLNGVALRMAEANPVFGAGLNNFMAVFDRYAPIEPVIYPGYPAHDLYLIVFGETGGVGLLALLAVLVAVLVVAVRLARSGDRLLCGLGFGVTAMIVFYALEEVLSFSLRIDGPLALFWILAALAVAARRMAAARARREAPHAA